MSGENLLAGSKEKRLSHNSSISEVDDKQTFKCLVANDDPCQLFMKETMLKLCGCDVVTSRNGFEAYHNAMKAFIF